MIVYYLFQDPMIAWKFTQVREEQEGRRVAKDVFITAFFRAQENVKIVKKHFGSSILLNIIVKDFTTDFERVVLDVPDIDPYLPRVYTAEELEKLL